MPVFKKLLYSIKAEIASLMSLLFLDSFMAVLLTLALHLSACFLLVLQLINFLPERYRKHKKRTFFSMVSVSFLLLFPGYLILLATVLHFLRIQRRPKDRSFHSFSLDDLFMVTTIPKQIQYGESPLSLIEKSKSLPENKIEVISSIILNIKDVRLIRKIMRFLGSENDEFRLFTFSKLYSIEKSIHERIKKLTERISHQVSEEEKSFIFYELAQSFYDLVYYKLVDKEQEQANLKKAEHFIKEALKGRDNPEFLILLGKIYLMLKDYTEAYNVLQKVSESYNIHPIRHIPYVAECLFGLKKYGQIKPLFNRYSEYFKFSTNPYLFYLAEFWSGLDGSAISKR